MSCFREVCQQQPHSRIHPRYVALALVLPMMSTVAAMPQIPQTSPADTAALVAVAASNPAFNVSGSWRGDPCRDGWYGLTCDGASRVVNMSFNYGGIGREALSGQIPPALGGLAYLEKLDLANNFFTGAIPVELENLARLKYLSFGDNKLTGPIPPWLGSLANMEELTLQANRLTGEIPPELGALAHLKRLYLGLNSLTGVIPLELGGLANVEELSLAESSLTGVIPPELGGLANVKKLYLRGNNLTGAIPSTLGGLANLEELLLSKNSLMGAIPLELTGLKKLRYLELSYNSLTGAIPPELGGLANLTTLYLDGNSLNGAIPIELGRLLNLYHLSLAGNSLTGAIPVELGGLPNLRSLSLQDNFLNGSVPTFRSGTIVNTTNNCLTASEASGQRCLEHYASLSKAPPPPPPAPAPDAVPPPSGTPPSKKQGWVIPMSVSTAGAVLGGIISLGFFYFKIKRTEKIERTKRPLADAVREELRLKGVDDFSGKLGLQFCSSIDSIAESLKERRVLRPPDSLGHQIATLALPLSEVLTARYVKNSKQGQDFFQLLAKDCVDPTSKAQIAREVEEKVRRNGNWAKELLLNGAGGAGGEVHYSV